MTEYIIRASADGDLENVHAIYDPDTDALVLQFDDGQSLTVNALMLTQEHSDEVKQLARLATAAERIADALEQGEPVYATLEETGDEAPAFSLNQRVVVTKGTYEGRPGWVTSVITHARGEPEYNVAIDGADYDVTFPADFLKPNEIPF